MTTAKPCKIKCAQFWFKTSPKNNVCFDGDKTGSRIAGCREHWRILCEGRMCKRMSFLHFYQSRIVCYSFKGAQYARVFVPDIWENDSFYGIHHYSPTPRWIIVLVNTTQVEKIGLKTTKLKNDRFLEFHAPLDGRRWILYNYPPKGRWIVVDIYRDASRYISTALHRPWGGYLFQYLPNQMDKKRFFNFALVYRARFMWPSYYIDIFYC